MKTTKNDKTQEKGPTQDLRNMKLRPGNVDKLYRENDYGMWVGRGFYPKKEDYVAEAERMGCCKKVPYIPDDAELGKTRIFLVHKEKKEHPIVFGYFILDGIVACTKLQQMIETVKQSKTKAQEFPVTALTKKERVQIPARGCGNVDPVSYYFVGPDDITAQKKFRTSATGSKVRIVLLPPIVVANISRFRGLMRAENLFEFAIARKNA